MKCSCSGLDCVAFSYSVEISGGRSGSVSDRRLRRDGETSGGLQYRLFRDGLRTQPWDTGANKMTILYLLTLFGQWQSTAIYGRIPAGQSVASGSYSDDAAILVTY